MARVLVLREAEEARRTAHRLARLGHSPILLPIEETRFLGSLPPTDDHAGFALTSARAVTAVAERFAGDPRPVFAVGPRTAGAARTAGFDDVRSAGSDAAALGDLVANSGLFAAQPILYAAGSPRTATLEETLERKGIGVVVWETYEIVTLAPDERRIAAAFREGPAEFALVLSAGQAAALSAMVERSPALFAPLPIPLALSSRIAEALAAPLRDLALISKEKTLPSLFAALPAPS